MTDNALRIRAVLAAIIAILVGACSGGVEPETEQQIRESLSDRGEVGEIRETAWSGVYEVVLDNDVVYASPDGQFVLFGDLHNIAEQVNVSKQRRQELRADALTGIDEGETIVFRPEGEVKHRLWVFTDIDCGYCRRFHQRMDGYLAKGIEVHYLAFPRTGPNSNSWRKARAVWCSDDRQTLLTRAKGGDPLNNAKVCDSDPVAEHFALGRGMGVRGTPSLVTEEGMLIPGMMNPGPLAQRLSRERG